MNHVNAEEAQDAPNVVMGMFSVNSVTAMVLFDSGASHSFASKGFVGDNQMELSLMDRPMLVHTPGSGFKAEFFCKDVSILIRGVEIPGRLDSPRVTRFGCDPRHGLVI